MAAAARRAGMTSGDTGGESTVPVGRLLGVEPQRLRGCNLRPAEGVVSLTGASERSIAEQPPLGAMPPLYLHALGAVLKAEGVNGLSRETARARRVSESLPALRRVVMAEATLRLGSPISLDLFGTAHNTLVHCFHWPVPFPQGGGTGPGRVRTGRACCAVEVVRPSCGPEEDAIGRPRLAREGGPRAGHHGLFA